MTPPLGRVVTVGPDGEQTGEFSTLLNPGCDPGPVHVHGLTAERLQGAPTVAAGLAHVAHVAHVQGGASETHGGKDDGTFTPPSTCMTICRLL
jgi:DNA polymerase-3 subunit epsilon